MKRMKKGIAFLLAALMMTSSIPVNANAATSSSTELKLVAPLVNIQVKDENGAQVSGSTFELYNSSNTKVASWTSGKESNASCASGVQVAKSTNQNEYNIDAESLLGKSILGLKNGYYCGDADTTNHYWVYGKEHTDAVKSANVKLDYNNKYNFTMSYYLDHPTDLTLPGNTVGIIQNSKNTTGIWFQLRDSDNNGNKIYPEYSTSSTPVTYTYATGTYAFWRGIQSVGGHMGGDSITISEQSTHYFKIKINVSEQYPTIFNEKGEMLLDDLEKEAFGVDALPRGYNKLSEDGTKYMNCDFCIVSGRLIQVPEMDADGNIEVYVSKDDYEYRLYTEFNSSVARGGGTWRIRTATEEATVTVTTPKLESNGITLKGLTAGKYKLVQTGCDAAHEKASVQYINVQNTGSIEKFTVINKKKTETQDPTPVTPTPDPTPVVPTPDPTPVTPTPVTPTPDPTPVTPTPEEPETPIEEDPTPLAPETGESTDKLTVKEAEKIIYATNFDKTDCKLSEFSKLKLRAKTKAANAKYSVQLSWQKIKGADGYIVYGAKCGTNIKMKKLKTIKNGSTTTWTQTDRKKGTYYKYIVVAYKGDEVLTVSQSVHETTPGGKLGNPSAIENVKNTKLTVTAGKTIKLSAKVKANKKYVKHVAALRYESANPEIATVNKNGVIRGKKAGVTYIYVYTQNGIYKKIKVTVK